MFSPLSVGHKLMLNETETCFACPVCLFLKPRCKLEAYLLFCMSALCSGFTVPPVKLHFPAFLSVYRGQGGQTMTSKRQITLWLLLAFYFKSGECFSNGKVTQACGEMIPEHDHDPSPQTPPYNITLDKYQYNAGDQIRVTLFVAVSGSSYFKGFLIEARAQGNLNGGAVGSFTLVDPSISQLLKCGHSKGSAVSHTSGAKKTKVQAIWTAPDNPPASIQFKFTVVQKYKVYWVQIPGPVATLNGATAGPPHFTTTSDSPTTSPAVLPNPFSAEDCGSRKSCLRDPVNCDPRTEPRCFFLSLRTEGQSVQFELSGPAEGYVSFALSLDTWMGNDDVYLCVRDGDRVEINAAYVLGRTHPEVATENALRDTAWAIVDGVIQCSFRRDINLSQLNRFNLDQSYFLFVAHGKAEKGVIHRHSRQPLISTHQKVVSGPPEDLSASRSPLLIKFHGVFMLVAWMTTVSTGVIFARYFKLDLPESSLLGQRVWFQMHRALMVLTVVLTCVGFTLPFIYRGGWSTRAGSHPYLGCTVMALAVIQPIMALFRPPPDSSKRPIFKWMHLGAGTLAQIIAVAAIFLGIQQQALLLPAPWSTGVLAGFVVWGVLADLIFELHSRCYLPPGSKAEDRQSILSSSSERKEFRLRGIILGVFLCGNLAFLTSLISLISDV
ncbi:putative ferric-chelate reductase 1 isoform X2 [Clupea harengus]|uniref:Ferric-chelate reductase 1 isoform X2 n=1 Tax=Clupea harengus TaxID=7950 RepID=A0A6P8GXL3_CLUHA|nr:putative ferric-chelate reductase 1 isoform X2 [Clupea harengus]